MSQRTSVATAHLDAQGVAAYEFDLEWALAADAVTRPTPLVVHTGSIGAVLEPGGTDVERLLRHARNTSTITYDPNARPTLMGDPATALARIEAFVELADVVKVSDEDLEWLMPGVDPVDAARQWAAAGTALVVVTRGGEGSLAVASGEVIEVPSVRVDVVDTVGAGDSYMGGLIDGLWTAGLLGAGRRQDLATAPADAISAVLERCARIAAITVSRAGANPPSADEVAGTPGLAQATTTGSSTVPEPHCAHSSCRDPASGSRRYGGSRGWTRAQGRHRRPCPSPACPGPTQRAPQPGSTRAPGGPSTWDPGQGR